MIILNLLTRVGAIALSLSILGVLSGMTSWGGPVPDVVINEILASNSENIHDEDGDHSDWIEICNRGSVPVNLNGWSLTDNPGTPRKWIFPPTVLEASGYLVVFASGKDRSGTGEVELHTNFKMERNGEYLALFDDGSPGQVVTEFSPEFPPQETDVSYGYSQTLDRFVYFNTPTPGSKNSGGEILGNLPAVSFSLPRGFYETGFDVALSIDPGTATIHFTLNGSAPSATHGLVYSTPISVSETSIIRAFAFLEGYTPSPVVTHTYFIGAEENLKLLPAISLVTDASHMTGPTGIIGMSDQTRVMEVLNTNCSRWNMPDNPPETYYNPDNRGRDWERPVSAEYIEPFDNSGFQVNAGIRVNGSDHTRPRLCTNSKISYRLYFRDEYGASNLEFPLIPESVVTEYDKIVLRAGLDDRINPFIRDELTRRLWTDMGHVGVVGTMAHLFINGEHKGYYNPTERPDKQFLNDYHGENSEWDVIKRRDDIVDGDDVKWQELLALAPPSFDDEFENFAEISQCLDVVNFIDYLLLNVYANTWDWPENNWVAFRRKAPDEKFRFLVWDAEGTWGYDGQGPNWNMFLLALNRRRPTDNEIPNLFQALKNSPIFRELFRERVEHHFFDGGAMTEESIRLRYEELAAVMSPVIDNFDLLPRNDINDLNDDFSIDTIYLPLRRDFFIDQLVQEDLFDPLPTETPTVDPAASPTPTPDPNIPTPTATPCDSGYYVLDSLGGRHRVGDPPTITGPLYFGEDMARDIEKAVAHVGDATSLDLVVLDSAGAAHFIANPGSNIPQTFYFGDELTEFPQGRAMDLVMSEDSQGLWVLTDFGGIFRAGSSVPNGAEEQVPGTENINTLGWDIPMTGELRNNGMPDPGGATLRAVSLVVFDVDENNLADGYIILDSQGGRLHLDPDGGEIIPGSLPGFPINHPYRLLDPAGYPWPFFTGLDIARDMELYQTEEGVVIFDGWGGIHPVPVDIDSNAVYFATNRVSNQNPIPDQLVGMPYIVRGFDDPSTPEIDESISDVSDPDSTGFDVASIFMDLEFSTCSGGLYTLDQFGGVFVLGTARGEEDNVSAPFTGSPYFFPALLAEGLEIFSADETQFETGF